MSLDSSRGSSGSLDVSRSHRSWSWCSSFVFLVLPAGPWCVFELLPAGPGAVQVCSGLLPVSLGADLHGP